MAQIGVGQWGDADRVGIIASQMVKMGIGIVGLTRLNRQRC